MNYAAQNKVAGLGQTIVTISPEPTKMRGSLVDACQELDSAVEGLEGAVKSHGEVIQPILEPENSLKQGEEGAQCRPMSPLAQSIFAYADRVRAAQAAIKELSARVSL